MLEILFFAARRPQRRYFQQVSEHLDTTARVVWYKNLWMPGLLALRHLPGSGIGDIVTHKIREKQNSTQTQKSNGYWLVYRWIRCLGAAWLFLVYYRYLKRHPSRMVAVWNGHKLRQAIVVSAARCLGRQLVYFENGLLPNTTTVDFRGVNACNSLPRKRAFYEQLEIDSAVKLPTRLVPRAREYDKPSAETPASLPERFLFIPFQVNSDSQTVLHSPWIPNMWQLFQVMSKILPKLPDEELSLVFKQHPSCPCTYENEIRQSREEPRLLFADDFDTQELIEKAEAVITINSTVGLEALLLGKKVITLGNAFYNIDGLSLHAHNAHDLCQAIERLPDWQPDSELRKNFLYYLQQDYAIPEAWTDPGQAHWQALRHRLLVESRDSQHALFLVSTALNLFVASGIALAEGGYNRRELCFIDQVSNDHNPYIEATQSWQDRPFDDVHVLPPRSSNLMEKLRYRRQAFADLRRIIQGLRPGVIYVGNDRRVEFQFAMHYASQLGIKVKGVYMDDGTFTYVGRPSKGLVEEVVDNALKKWLYGSWWQQPPTVGASSWIDEAQVAFPDHVHPLLQDKPLTALRAEQFTAPAIQHLSAALVSRTRLDPATLQRLDVLLTLPHASLVSGTGQYGRELLQLVSHLSERGLQVGIKYHPREKTQDPFKLCSAANTYLLPAVIGFEAILPLLDKPVIIGDVSTTLLSSQWLRPDLRIIAMHTDVTRQKPELISLFEKLHIPMAKDMDELLQLIGQQHASET